MARKVPINGRVLAWAMEEGGFTPETLAEKAKVDPQIIVEWVNGDDKPTRGQFTKLVEALKRPSAILFLPSPPSGASLTAGFRMAPGPQPKPLTPDQLRQVRWARRLQQEASELLRDAGAAVVTFPVASIADEPGRVATAVREFLGVTIEDQRSWDSDTQALRAWRGTLEMKGVFVLQLSLGKGVRGFSAWDEFAPLAAVNSHYNNVARIFSMLHEVGHLVLRDDSSCSNFVPPAKASVAISTDVERWCEELAAALLLPADALTEVIRRLPAMDGVALAKRIANQFKVSVRASALRLIELNFADRDLYPRVEVEVAFLDDKRKGGPAGGGQVRIDKRYSQLGNRLMETFGTASEEGRLTERQVRDYLKIGGPEFDELRLRTVMAGSQRR